MMPAVLDSYVTSNKTRCHCQKYGSNAVYDYVPCSKNAGCPMPAAAVLVALLFRLDVLFLQGLVHLLRKLFIHKNQKTE